MRISHCWAGGRRIERGGKVVNFGLCNGTRVPMVRKKELIYKIEKQPPSYIRNHCSHFLGDKLLTKIRIMKKICSLALFPY